MKPFIIVEIRTAAWWLLNVNMFAIYSILENSKPLQIVTLFSSSHLFVVEPTKSNEGVNIL